VKLFPRRFPCRLRLLLTIIVAIAVANTVQAAEIKLMSSGGMKVALIDIIPAFELATKHKVAAIYAAPGVIKDRILAGEPTDVLVFPAPGLDDLVKQGKIAADSKIILARSGMGVAARAGAPKPDISTPDALKRTLLAAKSIIYTDPALRSPSGLHFANVLERLGIAEEMKGKSNLHNGVGFNAEFVASGEIELGIQQISEIVPVKGVELVGPLPPDLQLTAVYANRRWVRRQGTGCGKRVHQVLSLTRRCRGDQCDRHGTGRLVNELSIPPYDDRFGSHSVIR
jgi:molybdate transport system substrate-binding protein